MEPRESHTAQRPGRPPPRARRSEQIGRLAWPLCVTLDNPLHQLGLCCWLLTAAVMFLSAPVKEDIYSPTPPYTSIQRPTRPACHSAASQPCLDPAPVGIQIPGRAIPDSPGCYLRRCQNGKRTARQELEIGLCHFLTLYAREVTSELGWPH